MRRHLTRLLIIFAVASGCGDCCGGSKSSKKSSASSSGGCEGDSGESSGGCAGDEGGGCGGPPPCVGDDECGYGEVCCETTGFWSSGKTCKSARQCNRRAARGESCVAYPSTGPYPASPPYPCDFNMDCIDGICQCPAVYQCDRPCGPLVDVCRTAQCCTGTQVCRVPPGDEVCVSTHETIAAATSTAGDERWPTLAAEGKLLVFVRSGSDGGDLWATRREDGRWLAPRKLPASASGARDVAPTLGPQGLVLYFASDRQASGANRGGLDIWRVRRNASGHEFGAKLHVDALSSACDDIPRLTPDGRHLVVLRRCGRGATEILIGALPAPPSIAGVKLLPLDPQLDSLGVEDLWLSSDLRTLLVAGRLQGRASAIFWLDRRRADGPFGAPRRLFEAPEPVSHPWASLVGDRVALVYAREVSRPDGQGQWELAERVIHP